MADRTKIGGTSVGNRNQITIRSEKCMEKYLQDVHNFSRLLTQDQEITYTKAIQKGELAKEEYKKKKKEVKELCKESKRTGDLPMAEKALKATKALKRQKKRRDELIKLGNIALNKLIEGNLRFVITQAKKYQGRGLGLPDLISIGNLGLIKAAKRFDHTRGFKFISYAVWWINQKIRQHLQEKSLAIRTPLNQTSLRTKVHKNSKLLKKILERSPASYEVAEKLNMSVDVVISAQRANIRPLSINAPLKVGEDNSTFKDIIEDKDASLPEETLIYESDREELNNIISDLDPREQKVIREHFGIDNLDGFTKTPEDIGTNLGITRERVRQIKEQGFAKIRNQEQVRIKTRLVYLKKRKSIKVI